MSTGVHLREVVDQFAILLATTRALLVNQDARPVLLDTYDSVSEHILRTLRDCELAPDELMELERQFARLRLAVEEVSR